MTPKSKKISFGVIFTLSLLAGLIYFWRSQNSHDRVSPKRSDVVEAVYGMGKVKAREKFEVKIGILTKVKSVFVQEGDTVKKGQTLITFDQGAPYISPINGEITTVNINAGETALPQLPLIKVENLSSLYIEVSLEQSSALKVKKNQLAKISFSDSQFDVIEGRVESIFPREDEFLVVINALKIPQQVLPGMSPDVSIIVAEYPQALLIPAAALNNDQITRERDNKIERIKVKTGTEQGAWVQLLEGDLSESDFVILPRKD